jgi:hypothetical protein
MKLIVFSFIFSKKSEHIQPIIYAFAVEEPKPSPLGQVTMLELSTFLAPLGLERPNRKRYLSTHDEMSKKEWKKE